MKSAACTEEAPLISLISSPPRLFMVFQSGPNAGGGCRSFNPFHLGFHPNIRAVRNAALRHTSSLSSVIITILCGRAHLLRKERAENMVPDTYKQEKVKAQEQVAVTLRLRLKRLGACWESQN